MKSRRIAERQIYKCVPIVQSACRTSETLEYETELEFVNHVTMQGMGPDKEIFIFITRHVTVVMQLANPVHISRY